MSGKARLLWASVSLGIMLLTAGCGPSADLSLRFSPNTTDRYEVTTEATKDFRFEQPMAGKMREEQTQTVIQVGYSQTITDVDAKGVATAEVTIDRLSVYMTNKNEERLSFDSTREADRTNPLFRLVGQQYTVRLSPEGKVVGFESSAAARAVTGGFEARLAERLVNEEGIRERHEIPALWGFSRTGTAVRDSWTQTVPSPPGLLAPKNYRKVYTLSGIETHDGGKVAVVEMNASESADTAADAQSFSAAGMGIFARMFDTYDDYTGKLLLSMDTGKVLEYDETLIATYLAHEMPANAPPETGPDTLTMRFTNRVSIRKVQ